MEKDLTDEFKKEISTVFESTVNEVPDEVKRLQENYDNEIEEVNIKSNKSSELTEKVDTYMNYVVEEWMKENELFCRKRYL